MDARNDIDIRSVYEWIPAGVGRILDVGCSWGDDTATFADKAKETYGVDVSERSIAKAKRNHPEIQFSVCGAEHLPFPDDFFDVVVMSEVLEHVSDETQSLNDAYRVLRPGGLFLLTTPHKGLFGFLDPANQKFYLKKFFPKLFRAFVARRMRRDPEYASMLSRGMHRHYSLNGIRKLLAESRWNRRYRIEKVVRYGLLLCPLIGGIRACIGRDSVPWLMKPLLAAAKIENNFQFGPFSYQIKICMRKLPPENIA